MDGVGQHIVEQLSVLNSIRSIFEDFNLVGLSEDVYIHVLNIVSKYTSEIFSDAMSNARYAGRSSLTEQDLDLAVENRSDNIILGPLHKDQLLEYAEKLNSRPLPHIKSGPGIKLAPEKYTITAPNYCIKSSVDSDSTFGNMSGQISTTPRIVIPGSNASVGPGGMAVYRVPSTHSGSSQGQRATLVSNSSTNCGSVAELAGSGFRVITSANTPSSLIRVQSSTFTQPVHPLIQNSVANSSANGDCASTI